jgi:hypothetical protein
MIIDATDLLYISRYDGLPISSDSDFTQLAARIRGSRLVTYDVGVQKTPKHFVPACDKVIYIENLVHVEELVPHADTVALPHLEFFWALHDDLSRIAQRDIFAVCSIFLIHINPHNVKPDPYTLPCLQPSSYRVPSKIYSNIPRTNTIEDADRTHVPIIFDGLSHDLLALTAIQARAKDR